MCPETNWKSILRLPGRTKALIPFLQRGNFVAQPGFPSLLSAMSPVMVPLQSSLWLQKFPQASQLVTFPW